MPSLLPVMNWKSEKQLPHFFVLAEPNAHHNMGGKQKETLNTPAKSQCEARAQPNRHDTIPFLALYLWSLRW